MFMGPLEAVPWQTSQMQGVVRFRDRLHAVCRQTLVDAMDAALTGLPSDQDSKRCPIL
jgi:leucyl-tRNA synthetase